MGTDCNIATWKSSQPGSQILETAGFEPATLSLEGCRLRGGRVSLTSIDEVQMADTLPSVSEVAFDDVSVSFARAHAGCTIVVLLGDARIRMIEQRAREVGSVAAVGCRSRSCGSTEQVG